MNLAELQQMLEAEKAAAKALFSSIESRAEKKATSEEVEKMSQFSANIENLNKQIEQSSKLLSALKTVDTGATETKVTGGGWMAAAANAATTNGAATNSAAGGDNADTERFSVSRATAQATGSKTVVEFKNPAGKKVFFNFGEQLQAIFLAESPVVPQRDKEMAINMLNSVNQYSATGLSSLRDQDGGYLIEEETMAGIMKQEFQVGLLMADCRKVPIGDGKDSFKAFALDDNSRANGSRLGGIVAYWVDEADTVSPSKPKLRTIKFGLGKMMALGYATSENLQDAGQLAALFGPGFADEFAFMGDEAVLNGPGTDRMLGILNDANKALITIAKESGQTDKILFQNILKMNNSMPARFRSGAKWYINQELMDYLPFMKLDLGTNVYPVYVPSSAAVNGGMSDTLFGRPIQPIEQCSAVGSKGDIIFANLDQYLIGQKGGVNFDASMHVRFLYDEMCFRATQRMGGQPLPNDVFTPYKGSKTYSPFITLAGGR